MKNFLLLFVFVSYSLAFAGEKIIPLPASTIVVVKTTNELNGAKLKAGQSITCIVAMDVSVDDVVLVKAGTPVFCQVDAAEGSGMAGTAGNLSISIQYTTTVDGKNVMLTGNFVNKGESSVGETVAVSVILCPLALLSSGDDAIIPAGTQIRAFTIGEVKVKIKE